jgi:hypothetical protein
VSFVSFLIFVVNEGVGFAGGCDGFWLFGIIGKEAGSFLGNGDKAGMSDHAVDRAGSALVHQPVALQQFKSPDICETIGFEFLEDQLDLADIGAQADQKASLAQDPAHRTDAMPGFGQVEKNPVDPGSGAEILDIGDNDVVIGRMVSKKFGDVLTRLEGKLQPLFYGNELTALPHCSQQGQSQGPGTNARFEEGISGPDVPVKHNSAEILWINDLSWPDHGEDIFFEGGSEEKEFGALVSLQLVPFLFADDIPHLDHAEMTGKGGILDSNQPLLALLGGQQDPFIHAKLGHRNQTFHPRGEFSSAIS